MSHRNKGTFKAPYLTSNASIMDDVWLVGGVWVICTRLCLIPCAIPMGEWAATKYIQTVTFPFGFTNQDEERAPEQIAFDDVVYELAFHPTQDLIASALITGAVYM